MDETWFFDGWAPLLRTVVIGISAYVALVATLRISGKRTLSKMNAFDLVVTVALGSTLSSMLTSKNVAVAQGVVAFVLLAALQYVIAWLSVRSSWVRSAVKSEPTLLVRDGMLLHEALRRQRVTGDEVLAALRDSGVSRVEDVGAVVLETDGSFTVLTGKDAGHGSTLQSVAGAHVSGSIGKAGDAHALDHSD